MVLVLIKSHVSRQEHLILAMTRSNKQDKFVNKAKFTTRIDCETFTANANDRWACAMFPELGSPAEGLRFKQWSESRLKDVPVVWE